MTEISVRSDSPRETGSCVVCAAPLPAGARKCTNCNEFQSFVLRSVSSRALQGLVSLLPLLTIIYVFLAERVEPDNAQLDLLLLRCTKEEVEIFGANSGKRAAVVLSGYFRLGADNSGQLVPIGLAEERIFAANESHVVRWKVDLRSSPGGLSPHGAIANPSCKVGLDFLVYETNLGERSVYVQCDCPLP